MRVFINKFKLIFGLILFLFGGIFLVYGIKYYGVADEGEDIVISSDASWSAGSYTYRDITITNNAILTLEGTHTNDSDGYGVTISARNIIIESGSSISANNQGYSAFFGPGKPSPDGSLSGGAGYGGAGGEGRRTENWGGPSYGSALNPTDLGSGSNGAGGGAIIISCDSISIFGNIQANGTGGGSGGSVNIQTATIIGSGSISANGGDNDPSYRGGGGGGRVDIFYESSSSTFNFSNITIAGGTGRNNGSSGTVFTFDKETSNLEVSSDLTLEADQGINQNGALNSNGIYYFNDLTVSNSSTLTLAGTYTNDTNGTGTLLNIAGDVTIETGSSISAETQGYAAQDGQGSGVDGNGGSGGGYGGVGGDSVDQSGADTYGSALFPENLGSGGGNVSGGDGGGLIKMIIEGDIEIQLSAEINASGGNGYVDGTDEGGGGSGGSIYLIFNAINGDGTISANGGTAPNYAGGGGGGRIALFGNTNLYNTNNISVAGGTCGSNCTNGSSGTIFVYNTESGDVEVSNDLTLEANQGVNTDGSSNTDGIYYFNDLTVSNNSTLTLGSYYTDNNDGRGVTLNLDGDLTVDSGSFISANDQGYAARLGSGAGYGSSGEAGSGGTYGGTGGISNDNGVNPNTYGNEQAPYHLGSGSGILNNGVAGGGAVIIRCLGNATVNGTISANGAGGIVYLSSWASGGGSGGSVFLTADNISGSGLITALGGTGGGSALGGGGGGGGGRIAIVYHSSNTLAEGNITTPGGAGSVSPDRDGSDGTVYISQKPLPDNQFRLKNTINNSYSYTNSTQVEIVPESENVTAYYEASSNLAPALYAGGWQQVSSGKTLADSEGAKTVRAWLKDENELIASSPSTATIILDQTNPVLTLNNGTNNLTISDDKIPVSGTITDALSGISSLDYQLVTTTTPLSYFDTTGENITINSDGSFFAEIPLLEGTNQITLTAVDNAGNNTFEILSIIRESISSSEQIAENDITSEISNDDTNEDGKDNGQIETSISNQDSNQDNSQDKKLNLTPDKTLNILYYLMPLTILTSIFIFIFFFSRKLKK